MTARLFERVMSARSTTDPGELKELIDDPSRLVRTLALRNPGLDEAAQSQVLHDHADDMDALGPLSQNPGIGHATQVELLDRGGSCRRNVLMSAVVSEELVNAVIAADEPSDCGALAQNPTLRVEHAARMSFSLSKAVRDQLGRHHHGVVDSRFSVRWCVEQEVALPILMALDAGVDLVTLDTLKDDWNGTVGELIAAALSLGPATVEVAA